VSLGLRPDAGDHPALMTGHRKGAVRCFWTNEPGMSMKTKDRVRKSRSRGVKEARSGKPSANRSLEARSGLLDFSTLRLFDVRFQRTNRECLWKQRTGMWRGARFDGSAPISSDIMS